MDVGNGMQCVWPLYIPHQLLVLLGSTGRLDIRKHFNREKLTERDFERKRLLQIRPRYLLRIYLLRQFSHRTFENLVDSRSTPSQPLGAKPNSIIIPPPQTYEQDTHTHTHELYVSELLNIPPPSQT